MLGLVCVVVMAWSADAAATTGPKCVRAARPGAGPLPPRTPWGDPDLQGVWPEAEMDGLPQERAPELGTRNTLTEEEFRSLRTQLQETG